ncbi:MAG TPA: GFA family protein [Caulobacteraceae bacterium]|nr:GFA family protein [Caulobacteraceae bacterium]
MRTSTCSCGECTVEVEGEPAASILCNCDDCRRRTGAPFSWSAYFLNEQVRTVEGPLTTRVVETPDYPHTRHFCSRCGSTLFWKSQSSRPHVTGFAGGCFNDPTLPAPTRVVRYSQRMPWAVFPSECEIVQT